MLAAIAGDATNEAVAGVRQAVAAKAAAASNSSRNEWGAVLLHSGDPLFVKGPVTDAYCGGVYQIGEV